MAKSRTPYVRPPSVAGSRGKAIVERVRKACFAFPQVTEKPSHGNPGFFINDKNCFCYVVDNHHADGRFALWCAAPDGMQGMLVDSDAKRYFVPPYVGPSGWIGVRLDRDTPWPDIVGILEAAYVKKAPPKVLSIYRGEAAPVAKPTRKPRATATRTRSSRSRRRPSAS